MRTSLPDVFAAGDCVALPHLVLAYRLGAAGAAAKTGRWRAPSRPRRHVVPGRGRHGVVKVFGLEVARTGLTLAGPRRPGWPRAPPT
jgi:NADPH-dependent 2,4-dienoyl-CoA reductase/sulfur reductase-like enzyme